MQREFTELVQIQSWTEDLSDSDSARPAFSQLSHSFSYCVFWYFVVKFRHSYSDFYQLTCLDFFPVLQFSCRGSSVQMFRPSTEPKPGIHAICQGIIGSPDTERRLSQSRRFLWVYWKALRQDWRDRRGFRHHHRLWHREQDPAHGNSAGPRLHAADTSRGLWTTQCRPRSGQWQHHVGQCGGQVSSLWRARDW